MCTDFFPFYRSTTNIKVWGIYGLQVINAIIHTELFWACGASLIVGCAASLLFDPNYGSELDRPLPVTKPKRKPSQGLKSLVGLSEEALPRCHTASWGVWFWLFAAALLISGHYIQRSMNYSKDVCFNKPFIAAHDEYDRTVGESESIWMAIVIPTVPRPELSVACPKASPLYFF
jgi:hypothetical protein